ncbi:MAG: hypothetical protein NT167_32120 [Verrucomicrobia bacterium]|nr:hypothetical protein [Verrucomicrobiota bacterium]
MILPLVEASRFSGLFQSDKENTMKKPTRQNKLPSLTKALPPDPEKRNESRARSADTVLEMFQWQTGADIEDALSDLLANLMHWCDRFGQDFQKELHRAQNHYREETASNPAMAGLPTDDF